MTQGVTVESRTGWTRYTASERPSIGCAVIKLSLIALAVWMGYQQHYVMACVIGAIALAIRLRRSESIIALQKLGLQIEQYGHTMWLSDSTRFFPLGNIRGVVINEVFHGFSVIFVLQIILEDADKLHVIFPRLLPRLDDLKTVRKGIRSVLFAGHVPDSNQPVDSRTQAE